MAALAEGRSHDTVEIIQRGMWVHGAKNLYELAREMSRFEVSSLAGDISCPTLLFDWLNETLAKRKA